jgi:hypothetical protein
MKEILVAFLLAQAVIKSPNYEIQMPNFNSGAGIPTSTKYKVNTTIGQTAPGPFSSTNYKVLSGFQYIHSIIPFSFAISSIAIPFGTLSPDTPQTIAQTLTVSAGGAGGYQVTAKENHPLKILEGVPTIPDTNCDASCDESTAGVWSETTKYGFGYTMHGNDVPSPFPTAAPAGNMYKHFADESNSETAKVVMSSTRVGRSRVATVTYKINVSSLQEAGQYQNIIYYTAIPSY